MRVFLGVIFFWIVTIALSLQGVAGTDFPPIPVERIRPGQALEQETLEKLLADHFQKILPSAQQRVEIRDFRSSEKIAPPRGILTCQVSLPRQAVRGGNISGMMDFRVDGGQWKKIRFNARVDIYADVLVARHYLKKHQIIQPDDLYVETRNIASLPPDVLTQEKEALGKRTTLAINASEVLRETMVEIPPVVKKGDRVILLVENDQFRITTMAEAKESGRKGDRVKLLNLSSKKEVVGRVIDANTVQVDY